ncbi:MAG TPA: pilus assembly protein PilY [Myxococcaceae bacterium]|nr:pilus assembly protein PilY [Myxococcaceae bacterium]
MHCSWTSHLRRLSATLVVLGATGLAFAQTHLGDASKDTAACCQLTTSLIQDVLRGKDVAGDERFFASEGAPPNIHFLIDTSGSMKELAQISNSNHTEFFNLTSNGCVNPRLDAFAAANGWDPNFLYPVPDPGTGLGSDNGFPNLFQDARFYGYMYWQDLSNPPTQWDGREAACQSQVPDWAGARAADYAQCLSCLSTKGYYKLPEAEAVNSGDLTNPNFIFWGRYLNFNPPKYVTARAVLKQVIKDLRRVRAGYSYFTSTTTSTELGRGQNPSCDQILSDSSSFDSNRASYINGINGLTFTTGTPLARSLLNVGYYFTSDDGVYRDVFGFGTGYGYPSAFRNGSLSAQGRSVCWGCQVSSAIIITDGEPSVGDTLSATVISKMRTLNGGPVYCPDSQPCGAGPAASQRDKGASVTNYGDDHPNYYLDDVARMLANQDLQRNTPPVVGDFNTAGKQTVSTYTVGFGINSNLLRNAAHVGGGLYYTADNAAALKQALLEIINTVQTRATSFSSAAASSLQVRSAGSTLIPRFKPSRNKTSPWQGYLYRFDLGPERVLDCVPNGAGDLNNDGDCADTHLIDKNGQAVIENDEGDFVLLNAPTTPATPYWEAGAKLRPAGNTTRWQTRRIYTLVDSNGDKKLDSRDTPIEFSEANLAALRDSMGISDNPTACDDLAGLLGVGSLSPDDCARYVIQWYRGRDVFNPDPALRDYDRPFLLHDIFHSSPINVEPPTPKVFCDFSNQCTYTLFSGKTERETGTVPTAGADAYDRYVYELGGRDKIVLVGANGGMLHAFHNGKKTGFDPVTKMSEYNEGTGEELWAFIPPDMLAKLKPNVGKHAYFVDGTPMVREVWLDGTGGAEADGKKQWQEYRTVAVVGSGRGGVHRFALDLTRLLGERMDNPANILVPNTAGDFLWMWPQPCDALALQVGESFSNFAPRPPPIGPVALTPQADDALRALYEPAGATPATPWTVDNTPARERWVVALNGGYDQTQSRGRGMAIVDLKTGHTLWSFFHGDGQSRSQHLRYPIGAGLSLLDIGSGTHIARDADLLMDSATVGDYGGQLWMLRLWKPGTWDAATGRIDNWFAARAFRVENPSTSTDPENVRGPFTYMTTNTLQPETGYLRTFVGTGDKENLLDKGSVCRLSNPRACAAQGCQTRRSITVERGGSTVWSSSANYQNFHYAGGTSTVGTAGNSCGGAQVTLNWTHTPGGTCANDNDGSIQYTCDGNSSSWSCRETANSWVALKYEDPDRPYPQRFYGVWTFGVSPSRIFNTDAEATTYEAGLRTDADLVNVGQFDSTGKVIEGSQQEAPATGNGWYIEYAANDERTGSTGTLVNGCMIWGSFEPSGAAGVVCPTTGTNKSRLYQSNFATGRANCAAGFFTASTNTWARYIAFTTVASTPEPVAQLTLAGGQLSRGVTIVGAGTSNPTGGGGNGPFSIGVRSTSDAVKSLYQIELDRRAHDCRHEGIAEACE